MYIYIYIHIYTYIYIYYTYIHTSADNESLDRNVRHCVKTTHITPVIENQVSSMHRYRQTRLPASNNDVEISYQRNISLISHSIRFPLPFVAAKMRK